jgi:serine/threonine protein kinase
MSLTTGTLLGKYEIIAPIGEGGMGEVYRGRDLRLGREVAIKVMRPEVAGDAEQLARFEREARLLAALNHPNIAVIHDLEEQDGVRFLIMELVPGETLAERLAAGPLPLRSALGICRQIAEAVAAAHRQGIIHRDLKPGNVKVTPDGRVKVLDFGLAKTALGLSGNDPGELATITFQRTREGVVLGTPAYMSPEQARGKPLDSRTDIWAFGCILYEALTRRRPFDGETVSDVVASVLAREPDWTVLPSRLSPQVAQLVQRCLEKDLARRLPDITEAFAALDQAIADSPVARFADDVAEVPTVLRATPAPASAPTVVPAAPRTPRSNPPPMVRPAPVSAQVIHKVGGTRTAVILAIVVGAAVLLFGSTILGALFR